MNLLQYLYCCYRAYRDAPAGGFQYFAICKHGVPMLTVLIARDRKAWELSQFAINVKSHAGSGDYT